MKNSMFHWNGDQCCAIDVETTGTNPKYSSIWQIAILALDTSFNPRKDVPPFYTVLRPLHQDLEGLNKSRHTKRYLNAQQHAVDADVAIEHLEKWLEKLNLSYNKSGHNRCKVIPLGHNYAHDIAFMKDWLGEAQYDEWFSCHYRDTMLAGSYINDSLAFQAEEAEYSRLTMGHMCAKQNITNRMAHDALQDCIATAKLYQRLTSHRLVL